MNGVTQTMFNCIKCEICGQNEKIVLPEVSARFLIEVYKLSKAHDVAHLVGDALNKSSVFENLSADIDENERAAIAKVKEKFDEQIFTAVYRYETINYELEQICKTLEEAKIPFIPLKGSVIRKYYPDPWMRTSCDIDILVREEDLNLAVRTLCDSLKYTSGEKTSHDIKMYSENGVHLELHFSLIESDVVSKADIPLQLVWNYVQPINGTSRHAMNDEMFYYYHIAHMAKHFVHGGCGVRPFADLWLYNRVNTGNTDKRNKLLSDGELLKFSEAAENLAAAWFGNKEYNEITQEMEDYILQGGVYGTLKQNLAMSQNKKGGKFRHLMSRIFLSYKDMAVYYPSLKKCPILFPFYQVRRWCRILFCGGRKAAMNEIKVNKNITTEEQERAKKLLEELNL